MRRYPSPDASIEVSGRPVAIAAFLPVAVVVVWQFPSTPLLAGVVGATFALFALGLFAALHWGDSMSFEGQARAIPRLLDAVLPVFLLAIPIFWLGAAIWQLLASGGVALIVSHGWIVVVAGARAVISFDAETVAKGTALLFPLAILLVVLLTLTNEFWEVAVKLSVGEVAALALILVGPVLAVLILRLRTLVSQRSAAGGGIDPDKPISRAQLADSLNADAMHDEVFSVILKAARDPRAGTVADDVLRAAQRSLGWIVMRRLVALVLTVALALFAYLYTVAVIAVPRDVASDWSNAAVADVALPLLGITLPSDPYVGVCGLLTTIATATFVAFLIIEEESSATLVNALLEEPRERAVVLGTPYALLAPRAQAESEPLSESEFLRRFEDDEA